MKFYTFDPFLFEPDSGKLAWPGGEELLRPKTAKSLEVLIEHRDRPLSRQELLEIVWKETSVTPNVLYQSIKEIRHCLGGREESQAFLTSSRNRGYQWVFPQTETHFEENPNLLALRQAKETALMKPGELSISEASVSAVDSSPQTDSPPAKTDPSNPLTLAVGQFGARLVLAASILISLAAGFTFSHLLGEAEPRPAVPAVIDQAQGNAKAFKVGVVHKSRDNQMPVSCLIRERLSQSYDFVCIPSVQIDQAFSVPSLKGKTREQVNLAELLSCDLVLDPLWDPEVHQLSYSLEYPGGKIHMNDMPFRSLEEAVVFLTSQIGHQAQFIDTFILAQHEDKGSM